MQSHGVQCNNRHSLTTSSLLRSNSDWSQNLVVTTLNTISRRLTTVSIISKYPRISNWLRGFTKPHYASFSVSVCFYTMANSVHRPSSKPKSKGSCPARKTSSSYHQPAWTSSSASYSRSSPLPCSSSPSLSSSKSNPRAPRKSNREAQRRSWPSSRSPSCFPPLARWLRRLRGRRCSPLQQYTARYWWFSWAIPRTWLLPLLAKRQWRLARRFCHACMQAWTAFFFVILLDSSFFWC